MRTVISCAVAVAVAVAAGGCGSKSRDEWPVRHGPGFSVKAPEPASTEEAELGGVATGTTYVFLDSDELQLVVVAIAEPPTPELIAALHDHAKDQFGGLAVVEDTPALLRFAGTAPDTDVKTAVKIRFESDAKHVVEAVAVYRSAVTTAARDAGVFIDSFALTQN
jgi:hypothetical protein